MSSYRLPEEFETQNYYLRRPDVEDAAAIFAAYSSDATVTKYLTWLPHQNVSQTVAHLEASNADWDQGKRYAFLAFHRDRREVPLGMFDARPAGFAVSYGYVLRASAWGQGCASEIMRRLVGHALSHRSVFRAEAFCDVENTASARVLEKAGMSREGLLRRYLVHPNLSDEPRDCLVYSRVR
ncbi:GNAT family N-acetyltransferase [Palleronia sp. LCG004]|uniref:GNAT family N-acetyltransferase n=1 Tax=Palleronia sp. LCG004 TaxID=3079304 RepID=UPI002941E0E0|nr:GNAT family N-acetyltransferase [Palleronia sp. LCG004]WOI57459.1 GNAT family N-acetyltransferase [Palleronia sp. LCG004]